MEARAKRRKRPSRRAVKAQNGSNAMRGAEPNRALTVYTIGHSTRALAEFTRLLREHGINRVADVRTIPRSRRNPQFNRETLPAALVEAGIGYAHLPELGGRRRPRPDSPNAGWRNASFRGFADYMQTPAFAEGLQRLMEMTGDNGLVIMCAEAVPWRCHRSLIADALTLRGVRVRHLIGTATVRPHMPHILTPWARVDGTTLIYPPTAVAPDH